MTQEADGGAENALRALHALDPFTAEYVLSHLRSIIPREHRAHDDLVLLDDAAS